MSSVTLNRQLCQKINKSLLCFWIFLRITLKVGILRSKLGYTNPYLFTSRDAVVTCKLRLKELIYHNWFFCSCRDGHGKTLVMVWNISGVLQNGTVSVIAKAHTDVEVSFLYQILFCVCFGFWCENGEFTEYSSNLIYNIFRVQILRVRVCPTDDTRLVTCGRDNMRFWRIRSNQLRSCPVAISSEYKIEEVTDVTFAPLGTSKYVVSGMHRLTHIFPWEKFKNFETRIWMRLLQ